MGEIKDFTGIDSEYERPKKPELTISNDKTIEESIDKILKYLKLNEKI